MNPLLIILIGCCCMAGCQRQESVVVPAPEAFVDEVDASRLVGKWQRPDGGYVLEIRAATEDGKLDAGYFNPKPINISQATWRRSDDHGLVVFIELRDTGYPGATYRLIYHPAKDKFTGAYHQPTHGETFAVEFARQ